MRNYIKDTFNPWRFAQIGEDDDEDAKHQMVSTSYEYATFGLGKHACPGRFFAACELKAMMTHLVLTYNVKMENEGVIPKKCLVRDLLCAESYC